MSRSVLVAGVGNIFLGDDGFGVEVVRRLAQHRLPEGVRVADFGIRGVHLAYELTDYDTTILVDASPRGGDPGTVYVLELDAANRPPPPTAEEMLERGAVLDAHGMAPDEVFALVDVIGGTPGRALVVGCEPASVVERMGLSEPVEAAVDMAVDEVRMLIEQELGLRDAAEEVKT